MAKREELRAAPSKIMINGQIYMFDELTPEKKSECISTMMERAGRAAGEYFKNHPEELAEFVKQPGVTVEPL